MKYPTTRTDTGTGRKPMPPDATDDERKLAAVAVQFENGDVSRENVAWLLNHCADQNERLHEAYECLIEAGFACMTADEIAEMTFSTSEEQAKAANAVRDIFAKAYADVMGARARRESADPGAQAAVAASEGPDRPTEPYSGQKRNDGHSRAKSEGR